MALKALFTGIVVLASCSIASSQDIYRCVDDGLHLDLIHSDPNRIIHPLLWNWEKCYTSTKMRAAPSNPNKCGRIRVTRGKFRGLSM
jgi:hypothetical protein